MGLAMASYYHELCQIIDFAAYFTVLRSPGNLPHETCRAIKNSQAQTPALPIY